MQTLRMSDESSPFSNSLWYYADAENQPIGPLPFAELEKLVTTGVIQPGTQVIESGGADWRTFAQVAPPPATPLPPPLPRSAPPPLPQSGPVKAQSQSPSGFTKRTKILAVVIAIPLLLIVALSFIAAVSKALFRTPLQTATQVPVNEPPRNPEAMAAPRPATPPQAASTVKAAKQFEKFLLGEFRYEIKTCMTRQQLGSEFYPTNAEAEATFLVVRYAIENESNQTKTVLSDDFILRDARGREFRAASRATTALMMEGKNHDFIVRELQPGIWRYGLTAFEIPNDALEGQLIIFVPEKGFLGTKQIAVPIRLK